MASTVLLCSSPVRLHDGLDVDLDKFPLAVEPSGQMPPPGLNLGHVLGCFQPLVEPFAWLALASKVGFVRLAPIEDVADVIHRPHSMSGGRW